MTPDVDVMIEAESWSALADLESLSRRAIDAALAQARTAIAPHAEVSIMFCDDARIRELNQQWRGLDKPTNVLSFPAAQPSALATAPLLGDIVVAFETVERESRDEDKPLQDHVSHMIVHGFLHLLGYDHETDADADVMETAERGALARLGVADPYAGTVPSGETRR
ncbi:MAG: rRNA maturation RNase YbeY [Beijerinckiaceae bacterium]|jgi:probable rRNA maturation factor|nr:rRNA maturation RNase YbeY [Beijerinckiaceae bacterium]MBX9759643.1 rRNA maturation RNase YbeY [Beijerinckiaceae bacterium]